MGQMKTFPAGELSGGNVYRGDSGWRKLALIRRCLEKGV
jgi:hypothetical protein